MKNLADYKLHPRFASARQSILDAGSDHLGVFGGEKEGGYHVQQNPDEFAALICFLSDRCKPFDVYGEIGTAAGGNLRLMYELIGFDCAVVLDDGRHPRHKHFADNTKDFGNKLGVHIGDSHAPEAASYLAAAMYEEENGFDAVFIDGDHSYEGVKKDIELVSPYCAPATLLIFHDTVCCDGVYRAFQELPNKLAEFIGENQKLGIGVARFL